MSRHDPPPESDYTPLDHSPNRRVGSNTQLSDDELISLRKLLRKFEYDEQRAANFKARLPLLAFVWSAITAIAGIGLTLWSNRGGPH